MAPHLRPSKSSPIPFLLLFFFFLAIPIQSQDSAQPDIPPKEGDIEGVEKLENAEGGQSEDQSAQPPSAQSGGGQSASPKCGTAESDFAPCLARERADHLFKHCCSQYVPVGCHSLCQYEADELTARNLLLQAVKTKKCDLKHFGTILYCASQNQDNRKCCQHLNLADSKLGVGERCLRFCDPGGEGGIESIARSDVTCLFNWNVLMYCHHAGIKLV